MADIIQFGAESNMNVGGAAAGDYSIALLDTNKIVVVYESNTTGYPCAKIGTISGNTISYGTEVALGADAVDNNSDVVNVCKIATDKFAVAWCIHPGTNQESVETVVCTVSGTTITVGVVVELQASISNQSQPILGLKRIEDNKYMVFWTRSPLKMIICTVSGTTITAGALTSFPTNPTGYGYIDAIRFAYIESNRFVVIVDYANPGTYRAIILKGYAVTISGTVPTIGTQTDLGAMDMGSATGGGDYFDTDRISTDKFAVTIADYSSGKVAVGTVSGTTITMGAAIVVDNTGNVSDFFRINLKKMNTDTFAIVYTVGGVLSVKVGTASGTVVTLGSAYVINSAGSPNAPGDKNFVISEITDEFITIYNNNAAHDYIYGHFCTVSGNVVTVGTKVTCGGGSSTADEINNLIWTATPNKFTTIYKRGTGGYIRMGNRYGPSTFKPKIIII